jgi:hypothetical protein
VTVLVKVLVVLRPCHVRFAVIVANRGESAQISAAPGVEDARIPKHFLLAASITYIHEFSTASEQTHPSWCSLAQTKCTTGLVREASITCSKH